MPRTRISGRSPAVFIEYDCWGVRKQKYFEDPFEARCFYTRKLSDGKNPSVIAADKSYKENKNE